jgi:predicted DNA-binding transcriptional regulator YafY
MSRADRLLELIAALRRRRYPVSGEALATELEVSVRTLYRDIATLRARGAAIDGEPGVGYVLRPGFMLPPLMFSADEIEALVLGARWVGDRGDPRLAHAAKEALAKITAVVPTGLREQADDSPLLVGPTGTRATGGVDVGTIRDAIRSERKLEIVYGGEGMAETCRTIWPFALGFFDRAEVVAAWCELREAFRHFRTDRIVSLTPTSDRYPRGRRALMRAWREAEGIPRR